MPDLTGISDLHVWTERRLDAQECPYVALTFANPYGIRPYVVLFLSDAQVAQTVERLQAAQAAEARR